MDRRSFLTKSATGIITGMTFPNILLARNAGKHERTLNLRNINTGEKVNVAYHVDGKYVYQALAELDHLFRDHHEDSTVAMDLHLYELLYAVQKRSDKKYPLLITSGFRTKKTNLYLKRNTKIYVSDNSYHLKAMAADVSVYKKARVKLNKLSGYAKKWKVGGVGYYPSHHFMHLDTGRPRTWVS